VEIRIHSQKRDNNSPAPTRVGCSLDSTGFYWILLDCEVPLAHFSFRICPRHVYRWDQEVFRGEYEHKPIPSSYSCPHFLADLLWLKHGLDDFAAMHFLEGFVP
jgi:hypothetical protein